MPAIVRDLPTPALLGDHDLPVVRLPELHVVRGGDVVEVVSVAARGTLV